MPHSAMTNFVITAVLLGYLLFEVSSRAELVYESENLKNDGRTVLLGGLFPIHASNNGTVACGDILDESMQRLESMVRTIKAINENKMLLPEIKLAFSIRDTCSNPSYGLDQAFQYVQIRSRNHTCSSDSDNVSVSGVVGAQFSRVSIDAANLLQLYQIPQISYGSTADILGDNSRFDYFFRTIPPDSLQANVLADIIVLFKWKFVFMLYSDDAYGSGGIEALIEHLNLHNKTTICTAAKIALSATTSPQEYDAVIATMSQDYVRNATVVVLFGHIEVAEGLMEALGRAYMRGDYTLRNLTWIGTESWSDSLPSKYYRIVGGILSVSPLAEPDPIFDEYYTSLSPDNSANVWFKELWESRFGCSMSSNEMCGLVMANKTLNATEHKQTIIITLVSDAVYAFAHAIHSLVDSSCPNRTLCAAILEDRPLGKAIDGELLRKQLYNISFLGRSSNIISFYKGELKAGAFFIKNLQRNPMLEDTYMVKIVGTWDRELSLNFTSAIEWVTGSIPRSICSDPCEAGEQPIPVAEGQCCWSCLSCPIQKGFSDGMSPCQYCKESMMPDSNRSMCIPIPVSYLKYSDAWSIVLLSFTIVGLIATAFIIIVFLVYNKHRVVKASSRELSAILLVGLVLCYIMPFFFVVMPSPPVCAIRRFGVGFSFAVCFSALLIKTNRIYRIFNQKSLNSTKPLHCINSLSQVMMTLIVIAIQVLIAIVWLALDHPSTIIAYGTRSAVLRCGASPYIYLVALLGYNFIVLLLSTYYAFLARKVPENFNEAKYINVTLYTLCIIWLAFISTYFATIKFGAVFQATSLMIAIILSATTTLICIFMPKMVMLMSRLKEKQRTDNISSNIGTGTVMTVK